MDHARSGLISRVDEIGRREFMQRAAGETTAKRLPHSPALIPVFTHLALVLILGLYMPRYLADWYRMAAKLIG